MMILFLDQNIGFSFGTLIPFFLIETKRNEIVNRNHKYSEKNSKQIEQKQTN